MTTGARPRPRGEADLSATAGPRGPAGASGSGRRLKSIGVVTSRCVRDGKQTRRGALLHQQSGHGRQAIRPRRTRPLEYRERVPLDARCDLSRGRVTDPRADVAGELRVAEAASRQGEHRQETPGLRMVRQVLDGSPYRHSMLVSAGPGAIRRLCVQVTSDRRLSDSCRARKDPLLVLRLGETECRAPVLLTGVRDSTNLQT